MKVFGGVDPGLMGGIAVLEEESASYWAMPVMDLKGKKKLDLRGLNSIFQEIALDYPKAVFFIEIQQAYPGQGSVSNFSIGLGYGVLLGLLTTYQLAYEELRPTEWQKHFRISSKLGNTKEQSVSIATKLFPNEAFKTPRGRLLDGKSDSFLIAEYSRRRLGV